MVTRRKKKRAPQVRDPERSRQRLLDAGTRLFAARGFDGVSVSDIVAVAKINRRMLYHYFGDKLGLYREVFAGQWATFGAGLGEKLRAAVHMPAHAQLELAVAAYFDFVASHLDFVRLTQWEALQGGKVSKGSWASVREPIYRQIEGVVRRCQDEGSLNPSLHPGHLVITFLGAVNYYFAHASTISEMIAVTEPLGTSSLAERRTELLGLLKALSAMPAPARREAVGQS